MFDLLRGQVTRAWVVGLARGACEAAVMAFILVAAGYLTALDFGSNTVIVVPLIWTGVRTAEGIADHIDPTKTRANPAAIRGFTAGTSGGGLPRSGSQ